MKVRYPFLYLVLASGLAAAVLLALNSTREKPVFRTPTLSRDRVAVMDITGTITSSLGTSQGIASSSSIIEQIDKYSEDDSVKALVLRINSPGGTVVAAQEIYERLLRLRRKTDKVVVVSMAEVTASGGYYISCAADRIIANPGSITGSIGVIMEFPNLEGLFGKIGVTTNTIKSGEFKDTGSASRPMTDREKDILQGLIDDIYEQFLQAVAEGREMSPETVRPLADGRIFTGRQALEAGLVDELGDLAAAVRLAGELSGIEGEPTVLREKKKRRWWDMLESRLQTLSPLFPADGAPNGGRLLYLWR